jgi:hypothetical protein
MLRALTAKQWAEWEAFVALEGTLSDVRQDYRIASIVQMILHAGGLFAPIR